MKIAQDQLLKELKEITDSNLKVSMSFLELPEEQLNAKTDKNSWSILECIEHLNRYGEFYLPEIKKRIAKHQPKENQQFKSGFLGNYFAKSMLPKEKLNKMKTFKLMNPLNSKLTIDIIHTFNSQQAEILKILDEVSSYDLNKIKTSISISNLTKLKLGDTLRVVIYHNSRHLEQAKRCLAKH